MSSAAAKHSDDTDNEAMPPVKPDRSTVILLFTIAVDTTWRMFVPVIGGPIVGIWADHGLMSRPVGTIIGITIGVAVAAVLVRNQLKRNVNVK